jgi:hypothetical protein
MSASKYTRAKSKRYQELVALGLTYENAAVMAFEIHRATYYEWIGEKSPLSKWQKTDFLKAKENGRADLNNRLSLYVLKHAENNGKLALDYLKRLEPETYGDSQKLVGDKDNPITVNHVFSDDQLKRIITKRGKGVDRGDNKAGGN